MANNAARAELGEKLLDACFRMDGAPAALAIIRAGGVDLNFKGDSRFTPLIAASLNGLTDVVTALLATKQVAVNAASDSGFTALMWACANSHEAIASALLEVPGINVNARNNQGGTALTLCGDDMPAVRARLLALGATEEGDAGAAKEGGRRRRTSRRKHRRSRHKSRRHRH